MSALVLAVLADPAHAKKPKVYTAVRIDLEGKAGLCPGEFAKLDIFATEGGKEGKIRFGAWKEFGITYDIGPVSSKGGLEMPLDPEPVWSKPGAVSVKLLADPNVHADANLPVRYDCQLLVDLSGDAGDAGAAGARGSTAADADGGDGQKGQGGGDGRPGNEVQVKVFLTTEPVRHVDVLQVAVTDVAAGKTWNSAVAVTGGQLIVRANGGPGGAGGAGGDGGSGATNRDGGNGADGGDGGTGGPGGKITVTVDPSAEGKTGALVLENGGGGAGPGGTAGAAGAAYDPGAPGTAGHAGHEGRSGPVGPPPAIAVAPVGALWQ